MEKSCFCVDHLAEATPQCVEAFIHMVAGRCGVEVLEWHLHLDPQQRPWEARVSATFAIGDIVIGFTQRRYQCLSVDEWCGELVERLTEKCFGKRLVEVDTNWLWRTGE